MNLVNKEYHKRARVLLENWEGQGVFPFPEEALEAETLAAMFDHTIVAPDASISAVNTACKEAREHSFACVCVNPVHVERSVTLLGDSVPVCTMAGFPLGANHTDIKVAETALAVKHGAREINIVLNVGLLKTANYQEVFEDIKAVRLACPEAELKVILETSLLEYKDIIVACLLCREAGADFIQTSTGFSRGEATPESVSLIRFVVGEDLGVVAAGGIDTKDDLIAMLKAGATRFSIPGRDPFGLLDS